MYTFSDAIIIQICMCLQACMLRTPVAKSHRLMARYNPARRRADGNGCNMRPVQGNPVGDQLSWGALREGEGEPLPFNGFGCNLGRVADCTHRSVHRHPYSLHKKSLNAHELFLSLIVWAEIRTNMVDRCCAVCCAVPLRPMQDLLQNSSL